MCGVHVDWISAAFETPPEGWPGYESGRWMVVSPDGEVVRMGVARHHVEDADREGSGSRSWTVWTPTPGTLHLSGCPPKVLQRHNLWGSLDAVGYALEAGLWVRERVGLFPGPETWRASGFTGPRWTRLDLTRSYRFRNEEEAAEWLRRIAAGSRSRHGACTLYGGETAYFGLGSRRWALKVYRKRAELEAVGRQRAGLPVRIWDQALDWAAGVVRFELMLRSLELRKLEDEGLELTDEGVLAAVWDRYFRAISWSNGMARRDLLSETVPERVRGALAMWRAGEDLRRLLPRPTWYRRRREVLEAFGVDIASPPPPASATEASASVSAGLDPAGWDPEPFEAVAHPRAELKRQYGLELERHPAEPSQR